MREAPELSRSVSKEKRESGERADAVGTTTLSARPGAARASLTCTRRVLGWPGLYGWLGIAFAAAGAWFLLSGLVLFSKAALLLSPSEEKGRSFDLKSEAFLSAREFVRLRDSYVERAKKRRLREEKQKEREEEENRPTGETKSLRRTIESLTKRIGSLTREIEIRERKLGLAGLPEDEFRRRYEEATAAYYEMKTKVLSPAERARGLGFGERFLEPAMRDARIPEGLAARFGPVGSTTSPEREFRDLWEADMIERAEMAISANARSSVVFGIFCLAVSAFWWGFALLDPTARPAGSGFDVGAHKHQD